MRRADPGPDQSALFPALPKTGTQRDRVWQAICHGGDQGRTDEELSQVLRLSLNSVRSRRLELVEQGLVVASELRRETSGGNDAIVWVAVWVAAP